MPAHAKRCPSCKEEKLRTPEYFHRCSKNKDGLFHICKVCANAKARQYNRKNSRYKDSKRREYRKGYYWTRREYNLKKAKESYKNNKDKVIEYQKQLREKYRLKNQFNDPYEDQGKKRCQRCKRLLERQYYALDSSRKDGLRNVCTDCKRERDLILRYRITSEEFHRIWKKQKGKCAICDNVLVLDKKQRNTAVVDHNHLTGDVRGILCTLCNSVLGFCNDNQNVLKNAINYLHTHIPR